MLFGRLEDENINFTISMAKLEGRLAEREDAGGVSKKSFADVLSAPIRKVGKKVVTPRPVEKTVFIYPSDSKKEDSEETKKMVKSIITPKNNGWQVKVIRKVRKGGVVIETGTEKTAQEIKEVAKTQPTLR